MTKPDKVNQIIEYRQKKQKIQSIDLIVSRARLISMHKQGYIDEKTFNEAITNNYTEFQIKTIIPTKVFNNLCKKVKILKVEPCTVNTVKPFIKKG